VSLIRRTASFYRLQIEVLWKWRPGRQAVVCASGNLALIYFPRLPGRVSLETIGQTWPGMITKLAAHPGIGILMGRSSAYGAVAIGAAGRRYLDADRVEDDDPTAPFGEHAITGLKRIDGMANSPDLVAISLLDPSTGEVAAFEELIGSHGGLGGPQTEPFILHPADWTIDEPIVGAENVYHQIRRWLTGLGIELGPADKRATPATAAADDVGAVVPSPEMPPEPVAA
jgi:hypothetical protein